MNTQHLITMGKELEASIQAGEVIDAYQAADMCGIHHNNVIKACVDGRIQSTKFGRTWYMTPEAVQTWRDGMKYHRK
jgi:hypothetical protein